MNYCITCGLCAKGIDRNKMPCYDTKNGIGNGLICVKAVKVREYIKNKGGTGDADSHSGR